MQAELLGFLQASAPPRLSDGLEHRFEENPWRGVGRCMYNGFLKTQPFPTISSSGPQERQCSRALREPAAGCTESPALGEDEVPRVVSQQCALPGAGTPSVRHPVVLCPQTVHQELCAGPLARTRAQAAAARRPVCLSR